MNTITASSHAQHGLPGNPATGMDKKLIEGYDGRYLIDVQGNIWHVYKTCIRVIKPYVKKCKLVVRLTDSNGKRHIHFVHLLVADAFLPPRPPGYVVYHRNGDLTDPCASNLQTASRKNLEPSPDTNRAGKP